MEELNQEAINQEEPVEDGGKIVFANDVIATIAALAAADVEGVAGMSGTMAEGLSELFGKKNLTKGVRVETADNQVKVVACVNIYYGYKIQEVCKTLQKAIKDAIETMTGLPVVSVDAYVQSVVFEQPKVEELVPEEPEAPEAEVVEPEEN